MTNSFPAPEPHPAPPSVTPQAGQVPLASQEHDHLPAEGDSSSLPAGHRWMMLICCVPMLLIVAALLVTGAAGSGAILYALICVAAMGLMMFAMPGGHRH